MFRPLIALSMLALSFSLSACQGQVDDEEKP